MISSQCLATEDDMYELTIEQLMSMKINIATKTEETLSTVPSTITILSSKDIQALGISNAYDIINFIPGFQMTRGDWVGAVPKEHARGIYLDNGYLLVMINGQRLNESSFGKASVYTPFIPVDIIERVEVIRGPGSALYGSNAFLGVFNIITKKHSNQVILGLGEHNSKKVAANWSHNITKDLSLYGNLNVEQNDGQEYSSPLNRQVSDPLKNKYIELGLQSATFEVYLRYSQHQLDHFINLGGYNKENIHHSESMTIAANNTFWQNDVHRLWAEISYNAFEIASSGMVLPKEAGITDHDFLVGPYWRTQTVSAKLEHSWQSSPTININSGIELRHDSQIQAGTVTSHYDINQEVIIPSNAFYLGKVTKINNIPEFANLRKSHDISALYSQVKWQIKPSLVAFVGARYDHVANIDSKLSLRGALVWQSNENHTFKLQYGESFRPPVNNELYSNDEVTAGNPQLSSEFVKTTELIWRYQKNQLATELVFFNNDLRDFINKVPFDGEALFTFSNEIDMRMQGLETSINYAPTERLSIKANYSHLFDDPINESFKKFGSLNLTYQVNQWQLNMNALWRDSVISELSSGATFEQKNYALLSSRIAFQLDEEQKLSITANNLLDKQYDVFDPRVNNGKVPGRGRELSLQYHYLF